MIDLSTNARAAMLSTSPTLAVSARAGELRAQGKAVLNFSADLLPSTGFDFANFTWALWSQDLAVTGLARRDDRHRPRQLDNQSHGPRVELAGADAHHDTAAVDTAAHRCDPVEIDNQPQRIVEHEALRRSNGAVEAVAGKGSEKPKRGKGPSTGNQGSLL